MKKIKRTIGLYTLLFIFCSNVFAQNSVITFHSNRPTTIRVYTPIDNIANSSILSTQLEINTGGEVSLPLNIKDFAFVKYETSIGHRNNLLLLTKNDTLTVLFTDSVHFKGNNAAGNNYFFHTFETKGLSYIFSKEIVPLLKENIKDSINFTGLDKGVKECINKHKTNLAKLKNENKISSTFESVLLQDIFFKYNDMLLMAYQMILRGNIVNFKPSEKQKNEIITRIKQMTINTANTNLNSLKHHTFLAYQNDAYMTIYKYLSSENRQALLEEDEQNIFRKYIYIMLAPKKTQRFIMADLIISEIENGNQLINLEKALIYYKINFPQSEYITIIDKLIDNQNKNRESSLETTFIPTESIKSISDISKIPKLKGKYVYIDLWASYCMPCIQQFKYKEELYKLLNSYNNIAVLYISIDSPKAIKQWQNMIKRKQLNGIHLRASKELYQDFSVTIYNSQSCSIPRYILLDKNGKIIHDNLPRPNDIEKLKMVLSKVLKN